MELMTKLSLRFSRRSCTMQSTEGHSKGFTLIASLLMLLLMSGIAIGLLMMVNTESQVANHDMENNMAYHAAEGAMEKMASDLNTIFHNTLSPTQTDINNLANSKPTNDPLITYPDYSLSAHTTVDSSGNTVLDTGWGKITGNGAYKDLYAQILQVDLRATAQREVMKDQVTMLRTVEVA